MNPTKSFEPKYCPDCDEYAPCSCGRAKKPDAEKLKAELLSCISTALVSPALFESQSAELTKLKSDVERLRTCLKTYSDSLPLLLGHKSHWDHTMQGGIGCPKCIEQKQIIDGLKAVAARALEETK